MSDVPEAPGWWQASDGKWYPPEQFSGSVPPPQAPPAGYGSAPATQPPAFPPPGFAQPAQVGYGYGVVPPRNETLAIIALVLGLVGLPMLCLCGFGTLLGVGAIVTGIIGRNRVLASPGTLTGDGMALAGIILGAITTVLGVGYVVFFVVVNIA